MRWLRASLALACSALSACGQDWDRVHLLPGVDDASPPAPAVAAPDAGGSLAPPAAPDAGAALDAGGPASDLGTELLGYWYVGSGLGGCIDYDDYLAFFPDGAFESIRVDDDYCEPQRRGVHIAPGRFSLEGRELTLVKPGSVERHAVALGSAMEPSVLYSRVYSKLDAQRWQTHVENESHDSLGLAQRGSVGVELAFDAPLPLEGFAQGRVDIGLRVNVFDRDAEVPDRAFELLMRSAPWRAAGSGDWRQVSLEIAFSDLTGDRLADAQIARALGSRFGTETGYEAYLTMNAGDPDYLYVESFSRLAAPPAALRR
jgi:hypothetical protein